MAYHFTKHYHIEASQHKSLKERIFHEMLVCRNFVCFPKIINFPELCKIWQEISIRDEDKAKHIVLTFGPALIIKDGHQLWSSFPVGGRRRIRTADPLLVRQML